jgi:hypothetical protein
VAAMRNAKRQITAAECRAEIDYFKEQLQLLDATGTNDIMVDYLDKLEKTTKSQKLLLRARLDKCLEVNRKFTDFQLQGLNDEVWAGHAV